MAVGAKDVYAWGSNEYGQLGTGEHGPEACCVRPTPLKLLHDMMVTQVVCGRYHTICVTAQSQVFAWGHNQLGQLGLGDKRDRAAPTAVDALWALPVTQLTAGDAHSGALTTNGHMFMWGSNQYGQLGLVRDGEAAGGSGSSSAIRRSSMKKKKKVNQAFLMSMLEMGISKHKAEAALTETGNVGVEVATEWLFSGGMESGSGSGGGGGGGGGAASSSHSAGHAHAQHAPHVPSDTGSPSSTSSVASVEEPAVLSPKRVPLKGVRYIAAGGFHTVAVTDDSVYSWGHGGAGALGHGNYEDKVIPTRVKALMGKEIEKVSCGQHHTLLLRRDGAVYGCGSSKYSQLGGAVNRLSAERTLPTPAKISLPFHQSKHHAPRCKAPLVHAVIAGGNSSAMLTRGPDELPDVYRIDLLDKLQSAIAKAARKTAAGADKGALASSLKSVAHGVEMVFGSAAAISAAFGYSDRVGINSELLETVQQRILHLFATEQASTSDRHHHRDDADPVLSTAIADLHKFSMMQSMYKSAAHLLEDLNAHIKLLHMPERAQVLLAAAQNPLLGEHHFAKALLPRLCSIILTAPKATRHLLVKWWSDYPGPLLEERVVRPLQSYLTKELMATKKLTVSVMNAIKVLSKVEQANQISRKLPPEAFYNTLISEKMDVQDHYTAWRQTQDQPVRRQGSDGPFSFCSFSFLLDPRAKSNLLHIEARFQMEQTVAHARMEQQLYGGSSRGREVEERVITTKSHTRPDDDGLRRGKRHGGGSDGRSKKPSDRQGLRGLFFNILRSRFDGGGGGSDSPRALDHLMLVQREGSMHLPRPADCNMPGVHSDMCIVRVRRHHLVEDALDEIARQFKKDLFKPLRVHFIGEEGIDAGGVKKEFFQLLVAELLSPDYGMLVYQPESHTYWFNACSLEGEEQFMLLGLVLGLAIYNRVLLDFPLPLALYKKLLGQSVGLRDLEDMQPMLGRSLRQLMQYDGPISVEETFALTFSVEMDFFGDVRTIPLKPGGEEIPVTEENRHEYVELMVDYLLNRSIAWQFHAFTLGFKILCDGPAISLFNSQEVERLVCGNPNLDFDALERNAKYEGGYSSSSPAVVWMWQLVAEEFTFKEKKMFLKFFTGSDRSPIGGLGALKCVIQRDGPDSNKLPTSHTCFNTLLLPEYASKNKMRDLLKLAILNSEGFGLE